MAGFKDSIQSNLTHEDVREILQLKLGDLIDLEELLKYEREKHDEVSDLVDNLISINMI